MNRRRDRRTVSLVRPVAIVAAFIVLSHPMGAPLAAPNDDLRPAAEQGDANAQYRMGIYYQQGLGVPQDYAEAARWYRRSALQGHANARFGLGALYLAGLGVRRDPSEAARWFRLAAGQGVAAAQVELGVLYASGVGVKRDPVQAYHWLEIAASRSPAADPAYRARAAQERDAVAATMTPEQIADAQRLAAAFTPAP